MKLLLISSYRRPCGIAKYVEHLEPMLRNDPDVDLEIAPLPVDMLRAGGAIAKRMAREVMRSIEDKAKTADVVILQYEPGLFGYSQFGMWRNIKRFLKASRKVIVTYHTFPHSRRVAKWRIPLEWLRQLYSSYSFSKIVSYARKARREVSHIVQTRRERQRLLLLGIGDRDIVDFPLAFLAKPQREAYPRSGHRERFAARIGVEPGKLLGCFGFLAPYKGFDVAIDALRYLPSDTHLIVVGGIHPEGVEFGEARQKYISKLTRQVEELRLQKRVHFISAPGNDEFNEIMAACDAVILPYAEVGQTSSGPAALALDMRKPIYCASNRCFRELDKYSPGALTFFEIGNHMQLAQSILRDEANSPASVAARQKYGEMFTIERRARAYLQLAGIRSGTVSLGGSRSGMGKAVGQVVGHTRAA